MTLFLKIIKHIPMRILLTILMFCFCGNSIAQDRITKIEVSGEKFTQIVFSSAVKNKETGDGIFAIIIAKSNDNPKIIRLQYDGSGEDFENESNLQVETTDGYLYDIPITNVFRPKKTTYVLPATMAITNLNGGVPSDTPSTKGEVASAGKSLIHYSDKSDVPNEKKYYSGPDNNLYISNKKEYLKAIAEELNSSSLQYSRFKSIAASQNIELTIKGVYTNKDELYFVFNLKNNGDQPFDIKSWRLYRSSDKLSKKLNSGNTEGKSLWESSLFKPELEYNLSKRVTPNSDMNFTIVLSKFTIGKNKALYFDIDELNGERDIYIPIFYKRINYPINYNK